ncbi:MAG TPA: hypothetical protein VF351_00300 [Actinomycetota bacterium]
MDDYSALAQRISVSVSGVSGALILSRDGLVLGAYPNEDESLAKPAWLKFIALGEPERSFIEFADQVWAYVRRGPYAAFATAEAGTRPGVLVDQMEQVLLVVEEGRTRRDTLRVPDPTAAPSGKPRTSLHPQSDRPAPVEPAELSVTSTPPAESARDRGGFSRTPGVSASRGEQGTSPAADPVTPSPEQPRTPAPAATDEPVAATPPSTSGHGQSLPADDSEVDPILLAKEFSGLLQLDSDDDE